MPHQRRSRGQQPPTRLPLGHVWSGARPPRPSAGTSRGRRPLNKAQRMGTGEWTATCGWEMRGTGLTYFCTVVQRLGQSERTRGDPRPPALNGTPLQRELRRGFPAVGHHWSFFPAKSFCQLHLQPFLLPGELIFKEVCDLVKQSQSGAVHVWCVQFRGKGFYDVEVLAPWRSGG